MGLTVKIFYSIQLCINFISSKSTPPRLKRSLPAEKEC